MANLMRGAVLHAVKDLRYEEMPIPEIGPGEVLVRVRASGVCGSDVPRVMVKGTYSFPTIPGHEFAGEVARVGSDVKSARVGERVAVIPLIPCGRCDFCKVGEYALCRDYNYLGSRTDGGFAEYVKVPEENLVRLPEGMDFEMGAMAEPAAVSLHAIRRGRVEGGCSVAVFGAGTIGLLAAQWASILGAGRVFVADVSPEKLRIARDLGFSDTIDARERDTVEALLEGTSGRGVDLAVEAAGSPITFEGAIRAARPLGRVLFLGNVEGDVALPQKTVSTILRHQLTLMGSWNSSFAPLPVNEWDVTIKFMASGRLRVKPLISHRYPLSRAAEAFDMMFNRREFFNKVMFIL
ncbi:MAG: galactitol-1-phosphate 5-dehydrogenase [bacterium]